eukprot:1149523-Pelagomonas_calceolata.AAC.11
MSLLTAPCPPFEACNSTQQAEWLNPSHPLRTHPSLCLRYLPTLMEWGANGAGPKRRYEMQHIFCRSKRTKPPSNRGLTFDGWHFHVKFECDEVRGLSRIPGSTLSGAQAVSLSMQSFSQRLKCSAFQCGLLPPTIFLHHHRAAGEWDALQGLIHYAQDAALDALRRGTPPAICFPLLLHRAAGEWDALQGLIHLAQDAVGRASGSSRSSSSGSTGSSKNKGPRPAPPPSPPPHSTSSSTFQPHRLPIPPSPWSSSPD